MVSSSGSSRRVIELERTGEDQRGTHDGKRRDDGGRVGHGDKSSVDGGDVGGGSGGGGEGEGRGGRGREEGC